MDKIKYTLKQIYFTLQSILCSFSNGNLYRIKIKILHLSWCHCVPLKPLKWASSGTSHSRLTAQRKSTCFLLKASPIAARQTFPFSLQNAKKEKERMKEKRNQFLFAAHCAAFYAICDISQRFPTLANKFNYPTLDRSSIKAFFFIAARKRTPKCQSEWESRQCYIYLLYIYIANIHWLKVSNQWLYLSYNWSGLLWIWSQFALCLFTLSYAVSNQKLPAQRKPNRKPGQRAGKLSPCQCVCD